MREILFRGKNGFDTWITGEISAWKGTIYIGDSMCRYSVLPETIGQFTGFTDKNGIKIFEGDVVHCIGGESYYSFHEADEIIIVKDITDGVCIYFGAVESLEVIGNIHDNPELMEELVKKETEKAINYWNEKRGNNEID
ncbi:MAG: YopX family protein [Ruminococcus sp.]|nr:YopX family protein [Ruminococcus sp.]